MSAAEITEPIKKRPPEERAEVREFAKQPKDSEWVAPTLRYIPRA